MKSVQKQANKIISKKSQYRKSLKWVIILSVIGYIIYSIVSPSDNSHVTDTTDYMSESPARWLVENVPNPKEHNTQNWVSNPDQILSSEAEQEINIILQKLSDSLTIEVAVVALNAIDGDDPRDFAHRLFNNWGVGKAEDDNGLVILLTQDLRDITFETGYGLEGVLPDVICKRIQMNAMVPYLREDDWDKGMIEGIKAVTATLYKSDYSAAPPEAWLPKLQRSIPPLVLIIFSLLFLTLNYLTWKSVTSQLSPKENTPLSAIEWLAKGNRLNFSTLLGLIWLTPLLPVLPVLILRHLVWQRPRIKRLSCTCPHCKTVALKPVPKKEMIESSGILSAAERMELKLRTAHIQAFTCAACGKTLKQRFALNKGYEHCPNCQSMTLEVKENYHVTKKATTTSEGLREAMHECRYCGTKYMVSYKIPMISTSSDGHGSSSGSSGGGSFSGGSSGGGGSSSRF